MIAPYKRALVRDIPQDDLQAMLISWKNDGMTRIRNKYRLGDMEEQDLTIAFTKLATHWWEGQFLGSLLSDPMNPNYQTALVDFERYGEDNKNLCRTLYDQINEVRPGLFGSYIKAALDSFYNITGRRPNVPKLMLTGRNSEI